MQQKKLITFLIILFAISSAYLFYVAKNYNDPNYNKNWWVLYFENPKSDGLNFVIENHSDKTNFHYVISANNDKIEEKDISINRGEVKNIPVQNFASQNNVTGKKITVQVISEDQKKEIYKNFDK